MVRLKRVIQFLAQPRRDLFPDLLGVDARVHARMQRKDELQLIEIGLHRRLHVGILQLCRQRLAVERHGAMHLSQRR